MQVADKVIKYKILHIIEFDSTRKRMSVILEKGDRVYVYCKGADNAIYERLREDKNSSVCMKVEENIEKWSR